MSKFVMGKGFGEEEDKILINGKLITDILDDLTKDIVDDRGTFVHVRYNGNLDVHSFKVLNFKVCRVCQL